MNYYDSQVGKHHGLADPYSAPAWYGGADKMVQPNRRRLRILPAIVALVIPWSLYAGLTAELCFSFRFHHPVPAMAIVVAWAFAIVLFGVYTYLRRLRLARTGEYDPSWLLFMLFTLSLAWIAAVVTGEWIYSGNLQHYYERHVMDYYVGVDPTMSRGQEMMDAGTVVFDSKVFIDVTKSMGFRHNNVYCVAPISSGNGTLATYDFWAVGKDCCSGVSANFHCDGFMDAYYSGGLRLMNDDEQAYYRLAVQQAEATYQIQALHPLFFVWVRDAPGQVESWYYDGRQQYFAGLFGAFILQALLVTFAALGFARLPK